jgi:hypothetical protein
VIVVVVAAIANVHGVRLHPGGTRPYPDQTVHDGRPPDTSVSNGQRTGTRVLGRRAVLVQSWRQQPQSCEPRRNLRPRVASPNKWARIEALMPNRIFVDDHADARARWRDGVATAFPVGTYWLQRFASVPILRA